MNCRNIRITAVILCLILCVTLCACQQEKPPVQTDPIETTKGGNSILVTKAPTNGAVDLTPVYVSAFGDTLILATVPLDEWNGEEAECDPREISRGGSVACRGDHEKETPITKVIILENIVPRSTAGWFRNLVHLESIDGLKKLHMEYVTDMNHMFYGCEKLTELDVDFWDVSAVRDMTGLFDGCVALTELPDWYS